MRGDPDLDFSQVHVFGWPWGYYDLQGIHEFVHFLIQKHAEP